MTGGVKDDSIVYYFKMYFEILRCVLAPVNVVSSSYSVLIMFGKIPVNPTTTNIDR